MKGVKSQHLERPGWVTAIYQNYAQKPLLVKCCPEIREVEMPVRSEGYQSLSSPPYIHSRIFSFPEAMGLQYNTSHEADRFSLMTGTQKPGCYLEESGKKFDSKHMAADPELVFPMVVVWYPRPLISTRNPQVAATRSLQNERLLPYHVGLRICFVILHPEFALTPSLNPLPTHPRIRDIYHNGLKDHQTGFRVYVVGSISRRDGGSTVYELPLNQHECSHNDGFRQSRTKDRNLSERKCALLLVWYTTRKISPS